MDKIAVIGDSHVNFFGGNEFLRWSSLEGNKGIHETVRYIDNFQPFHLGSALAFNTNKYNTSTKAREKVEWLLHQNFINKGQIVLCSFGEIDLRVHVLKQAEMQNVSYEQIVNAILENYKEFLITLSENNIVWVWGPIPSQIDGSLVNPNYPYYGSEIERNKATEYFNDELKKLCDNCGFVYLSIFKYLINENYTTKVEYIADGCHLSQKAWYFAVDEFKKLGINVVFNKYWHDADWENRKSVRNKMYKQEYILEEFDKSSLSLYKKISENHDVILKPKDVKYNYYRVDLPKGSTDYVVSIVPDENAVREYSAGFYDFKNKDILKLDICKINESSVFRIMLGEHSEGIAFIFYAGLCGATNNKQLRVKSIYVYGRPISGERSLVCRACYEGEVKANQTIPCNFYVEGSEWFKHPNVFLASQYGSEVTMDYLLFAYRILDVCHPQNILEFNFGQISKLVAQYASKYHFSHTVLEHNRDRVEYLISRWKIDWDKTLISGSSLLDVEWDGSKGVAYQNFTQVTQGKRYDLILMKCPFGGGQTYTYGTLAEVA